MKFSPFSFESFRGVPSKEILCPFCSSQIVEERIDSDGSGFYLCDHPELVFFISSYRLTPNYINIKMKRFPFIYKPSGLDPVEKFSHGILAMYQFESVDLYFSVLDGGTRRVASIKDFSFTPNYLSFSFFQKLLLL